jgi:MFS family permease
MSRLRKALEFFGLRRSIVGLLGMVILVGMGERLAERFLPIYIVALVTSEWLTTHLPGFLNGLTNLLGALYSFPGGYLSDRLGIKRALLVFNVLAMCGFLIVILIPAWPAVFVGAVFFLSWSAVSLPATMDLVAKALPKSKRTMGVTMHSLIRRIPMAVGPVVGGAFIMKWGAVTGVRLSFVAALALAILALVLQQVLIEDDRARKAVGGSGPGPEKNPLRLLREMSPALRNLLVSDILIRFCEQIPYAYVVLWCMKRPGWTGGAGPVNALDFGILTSVEMATAVLIYIPVAYFADRTMKKPFVTITFVNFTLFPLLLLFCNSFWTLAGAFVVRGLKEFGEPTRKALIMDLAPEGRKAGMFGLYYLLRDVVVSVSAFGGAYLWAVSAKTNFLVAFFFGVVGTIWFALRGKDLSALPPVIPPPAERPKASGAL